MSRGLATANANAVAAVHVRPAFFAEFEFPGGTVRVWTGAGNKTVFGNTFTGVGTFGSLSAVEEVDDVSPRGVTFGLSGVPSTMISVILGDRFRNRPCKLWFGVFDTDGTTLLADPHRIYTGRMSHADLSDAGVSAEIQLQTENILNDLNNPAVVRWSPADHKRANPTDTFFDRVATVVNEPLMWPAPKGAPSQSHSGGLGVTPTPPVYVHGRRVA